MNGFLSPTTTTWPTSGLRADRVFERGGGDVLATGRHDDLLLAAVIVRKPSSSIVADVSGLEPPVASNASAVASGCSSTP